MREIILASASPRRADLLRQIGINFRVLPSNIDENVNGTVTPQEFAQILSWQKASSVAEKVKNGTGKGALVIGADTIVVKDGILGKPRDEVEAFNMIRTLQGEWHSVITGIAVIDSNDLKGFKAFEETKVKMRSLTDQAILSYIRTGEPMDKAGSYGIQGLGALLVERIEGCYFNVVGLPLTRLSQVLEEFDIRILN